MTPTPVNLSQFFLGDFVWTQSQKEKNAAITFSKLIFNDSVLNIRTTAHSPLTWVYSNPCI